MKTEERECSAWLLSRAFDNARNGEAVILQFMFLDMNAFLGGTFFGGNDMTKQCANFWHYRCYKSKKRTK